MLEGIASGTFFSRSFRFSSSAGTLVQPFDELELYDEQVGTLRAVDVITKPLALASDSLLAQLWW